MDTLMLGTTLEVFNNNVVRMYECVQRRNILKSQTIPVFSPIHQGSLIFLVRDTHLFIYLSLKNKFYVQTIITFKYQKQKKNNSSYESMFIFH